MLFGRQERLERLREFDIVFDDLRPTSAVWNTTLSKLIGNIFNFREDNTLLSDDGTTPFPILMHFFEKLVEMSNIQIPYDSYTVVTTLDVQVMYEVIDHLLNIFTYISDSLSAYGDKYFITKNETIEDFAEEEQRLQNDIDQLENEIIELDKHYAEVAGDSSDVKFKIKHIVSKLNLKTDNIDEAVKFLQEYTHNRDQIIKMTKQIQEKCDEMELIKKQVPNLETVQKYQALLDEAKNIQNRMDQNKEDMFQLQIYESKTKETLMREIETISDSIEKHKLSNEAKIKELSDKKYKLNLMSQKILELLHKMDLNENQYYSSLLQHYNKDKNLEDYEEIMDPYLVQKIEDQKNFWLKGITKLESKDKELKDKIDNEVKSQIKKIIEEQTEIEKENKIRQSAINIIKKFQKDFKDIVDQKIKS